MLIVVKKSKRLLGKTACSAWPNKGEGTGRKKYGVSLFQWEDIKIQKFTNEVTGWPKAWKDRRWHTRKKQALLSTAAGARAQPQVHGHSRRCTGTPQVHGHSCRCTGTAAGAQAQPQVERTQPQMHRHSRRCTGTATGSGLPGSGRKNKASFQSSLSSLWVVLERSSQQQAAHFTQI